MTPEVLSLVLTIESKYMILIIFLVFLNCSKDAPGKNYIEHYTMTIHTRKVHKAVINEKKNAK